MARERHPLRRGGLGGDGRGRIRRRRRHRPFNQVPSCPSLPVRESSCLARRALLLLRWRLDVVKGRARDQRARGVVAHGSRFFIFTSGARAASAPLALSPRFFFLGGGGVNEKSKAPLHFSFSSLFQTPTPRGFSPRSPALPSLSPHSHEQPLPISVFLFSLLLVARRAEP